MNKEEGLFSSKTNQKHCDLEYKIKCLDQNPEKSRSAMLERFVLSAESVTDWMPSYYLLSDIEHNVDAPQFDSWQAKYTPETAEKLQNIRRTMEQSLKDGGVITRVLQTQFMLQLLMINYLESLKRDITAMRSDKVIDETISLPDVFALLAELMLLDRDSNTLKEIKKLLVTWKNKQL